ncbi:MAG: hypothetical protein IPQ01_18225 [Zoogloea sp.]|nr:hypothetical protein [Zoogloea sp.]
MADEVRNSRSETSLSTKEITRMVDDIQAGAAKAVQSMTRGEGQVQEGVSLAGEAGGRIADIKIGATQVSDAVIGISEFPARTECRQRDRQKRGNHRGASSARTMPRLARPPTPRVEMEVLTTQIRASISRFRT